MVQHRSFVGRLLYTLTSKVLALLCIKLDYVADRLAQERAAGAGGYAHFVSGSLAPVHLPSCLLRDRFDLKYVSRCVWTSTGFLL